MVKALTLPNSISIRYDPKCLPALYNATLGAESYVGLSVHLVSFIKWNPLTRDPICMSCKPKSMKQETLFP